MARMRRSRLAAKGRADHRENPVQKGSEETEAVKVRLAKQDRPVCPAHPASKARRERMAKKVAKDSRASREKMRLIG